MEMYFKKIHSDSEMEEAIEQVYEDALRILNCNGIIDLGEKEKKEEEIEEAIKETIKKDIVKFKDVQKDTKLKDSIKEKLRRYWQKQNEISKSDNILKKYAHREYGIQQDDSEGFGGILVVYAILNICMFDWTRSLATTNTTIKRIVKVLKHFKESKDIKKGETYCWGENNKYSLYDFSNRVLWKSEMPFASLRRYSSFLINYPPLNFSDLEDDIVKCFEIFCLNGAFWCESNKKILVDNLRSKIKEIENLSTEEKNKEIENLSDTDKQIIKDFCNELCWHNQAIFTMLYYEIHGSMRLRYARECDRIVASDSFRHMQYKAQVMFNSASDEQRTRLTHSLEVANVGKTIAKQLGCNADLVEAIGLGHDVGHVPFGHQGEEALDSCLNNNWAGRFNHALQSLKVLDDLEKHPSIFKNFGITGLCLSKPVLEGILKHDTDSLFHDIRRASWRLQYSNWEEIFLNGSETDKEIKESEVTTGLIIGGLETQIAYWADKIAYAAHDWEEFVQSGLIDNIAAKVEKILKDMHQLRHMAHGRTGKQLPVTKIEDEIDIIRFIRYYVNEIREGISNNITEDITENNYFHIEKTFTPNKLALEESCSEDNFKDNNKDEEKRLSNIYSTIVNFVYKSQYVKSKLDSGLVLHWFTAEDYKLIFDYFTVAHDLIFLTGKYPKPYHKDDDVVCTISCYLTEMNGRCINKALQTAIIKESRTNLTEYSENTEKDILAKNREIFNNTIQDKFTSAIIDSLSKARVYLTEKGYTQDPELIREIKEVKKWFKNNLQKEMLVRLDEDFITTHNRYRKFIMNYYIGSTDLQVMRFKAKKIITAIFDFYMEHETLLPVEYQHRINFEAKRLSVDEYEILYKKEKVKTILPLSYLYERYLENVEENNNAAKESYENLNKGTMESKKDFLIKLREISDNKNSDFNITNFFSSLDIIFEEQTRNKKSTFKIIDEKNAIYKLCYHIAKTRAIADYISSMTERYAEKKYHEIISSDISWS